MKHTDAVIGSIVINYIKAATLDASLKWMSSLPFFWVGGGVSLRDVGGHYTDYHFGQASPHDKLFFIMCNVSML